MQSEKSILDTTGPSHQDLLDEIALLRQQLEEARLQSNLWYQQLHAISTSLKIGFWEWNRISGKVIFYSNKMADLLGLTTEELYSRCQSIEDFDAFIHPDDLVSYRQNKDNVRKQLRDYRNAHVFEYRLKLNDRKIRHIREMEFGVFDDEGNMQRSFGVMQDISDHRQTLFELKKSEQRFFSLFDQLPLGVLEEDYGAIKKVVDKLLFKGIDNIQEYLEQHPKLLKEMVSGIRITNVNQALIDLHRAGSKQEFLITEAAVDDWWDAEWVEFFSGQIATFAGGERFHEAERVDSKVDGSYFETRSITTIVKGHENDWARVITIYEDITSRKKDELDLIEAKELAEKASQAKSEFLSSMSHELRTPLNAILGFSQLFDYDRTLSTQQRSNAGEINRAGKHLLVLIDEILDLSRIEAGEVEVPLEPVSLLKVIQEALTWVENLATSRNVTINLDEESLAGVAVNANSIRLKQVFLNLFTNAVKYNRDNGDVFIEIEQKNNNTVCIGVRDTGYGIDDEKVGDLFQPFNRLGAETSGTEGTGIGLVITQQLVKLMNGELKVDSIQGKGTTFWIELNLSDSSRIARKTNSLEPSTVSEARPVLQSDQPFILVAEDNVVNRELMSVQLEMLGYKVDYAGDGAEALEKWQKGHYYVLLTDIRMPIMNGYDLIKEIRSLDITGTHNVSIIAITANAMKGDIEQCLKAGADEVISKPVELDALKKALAQWVPRETSIKQRVNIGQTACQNESSIDLNVLIQSVGNNQALHQRLLQSFSSSLIEQTDDIEDAFAWRKHDKLADAAHKLKSAARSLGALRLGRLCETLEQTGRLKQWPEIESTMPVLREHCKQLEMDIHAFCQSPVTPDDNISDQTPEQDISVLLVDDDYIMHRVTSSILDDIGIRQVRNAHSAPEALDILKLDKEQIDLVFCDLNMPGMDGVEFIRHLARLDYRNALVLTSGEDIRILRTVEKLALEHELKILGVIEKPVTPLKINEMLETFHQVVAERTRILTDVFSTDDLVEALDRNQLDVFFQPKVDLITKQVVGAEALVRWEHPIHGLVSPDAFIPMAEDNGLINRLTQQVCQKAIRYASDAKSKGFELNIAINISVDALNDLLWPDRIAGHVQKAGLDHSAITFEITESRLMEHISVALDILSRLSLKRFNLSIDDFGTGYSSLEQLQRIPFAELKIDRAFVNGAAADSSARAILESSVLLARKLNMKTVAEGVENQLDWDLLVELEIDQVQGYFISRPLAFDQFLAWLSNWQ